MTQLLPSAQGRNITDIQAPPGSHARRLPARRRDTTRRRRYDATAWPAPAASKHLRLEKVPLADHRTTRIEIGVTFADERRGDALACIRATHIRSFSIDVALLKHRRSPRRLPVMRKGRMRSDLQSVRLGEADARSSHRGTSGRVRLLVRPAAETIDEQRDEALRLIGAIAGGHAQSRGGIEEIVRAYGAANVP